MDSNGDGIDEEVNALVRAAIAFAARMAEEIARDRERRARQAEAESERRRAEYQRRVDAERAAARAQLQPVLRDQWWSKPTPERIGVAYEAAAAWEQYDDVARSAAERIRDEVQQRYGVDLDEVVRDARRIRTAEETAAAKDTAELTPDERRLSYLEAQRWLSGTDPELGERIGLQVLEARTEAESIGAQNEAIQARRRYLAAETELTETVQSVKHADVVDDRDEQHNKTVHERVDGIVRNAAVARGERILHEAAMYDSADRRQDLAASLESVADSEEVEARILNDVANALPPSAAVSRDRRHPKARKPQGMPKPSREVEHGR